MRRLRILVLMRADFVPPDSTSGYTEQQIHEFKTEYDIVSTLRAAGHEVHPLGVKDEFKPVRDGIEAFKPHVAFTLLEKYHGKDPHSVFKVEPTQFNNVGKVMASPWKFAQRGQAGHWVSELLPHTAKVVDDLCFIRSMYTEAINHDPAHTFMNTGTLISGRPSMGSWVWYGLGAECDDLPGFVVMTSTGRAGQQQPISARQWHSGFLPSRFQGVKFRGAGDPVLQIYPGSGMEKGRWNVSMAAGPAGGGTEQAF